GILIHGAPPRSKVCPPIKRTLTQNSLHDPDAAQVGLLYRLAEKAGERYEKLARLYAHRFLLHEEYPSWALDLVPMPGRS
ncbi:MAG: hypothetical protein KM310_11700, partial [Clostridiales bacterium]|nr:hypothetical protein [Clostridiales bacterium]